MSGNSFGQIFRVTTFGESHGPMIGAVIDGCPAGLKIDPEFIQEQMQKRKPGQSSLSTDRQEADAVEIVSGVFEGRTTGAPITGLIRNTDSRSSDYDNLRTAFRPSHADFTYQVKFGLRDFRGGGRSSARETAARVFAGAVAQLLLREFSVKIGAYVSQVGNTVCTKPYHELDLTSTYRSPVRCPDPIFAEQMILEIESARKKGDTLGGVITGVVRDCPPGLGEPVFDRLHADLGKAMLSINAVKGFEIGSGFAAASMFGSEHNDAFTRDGKKITTKSNFSGGIQGGISNGQDIFFRVAFKPVSTLMQPQDTVNQQGENVQITMTGRHDPCVLPRATAIVEAMTAITLADHLLRQRSARLA